MHGDPIECRSISKSVGHADLPTNPLVAYRKGVLAGEVAR